MKARGVAVVLLVLLLSGCASLDYYAHLARGQYALLAAREPIAKLVAAPGTDAVLRSWALVMANVEYIQFFLTDVQVSWPLGSEADLALVRPLLAEGRIARI